MAENLSLVAQLFIDRTKALEAIQELHKPAETYLPAYDQQGNPIFKEYPQCSGCGSYEIPCPTRRLADQGLGGGNNG